MKTSGTPDLEGFAKEAPLQSLYVPLLFGVPLLLAAWAVLATLRPEIRDRLRTGWRGVSRSLPGRLVLVLATGLVLLIPLDMVEELRRERGQRLVEVQQELAQQWGGAQTVVGPLLWVPVADRWSETSGGQPIAREIRREFVVLPETLTVTGDLAPRALHRGLYDVLVYDAAVELTAEYRRPELPPAAAGHTLEPLWEEAQLVVELRDLSAVSSVDQLLWQGRAMRPVSGSLPFQRDHAGVRGGVQAFDGDVAQAEVTLRLRGMGALHAAALGEQSGVTLSGDWSSPSFGGFTLPVERTVGDDTFSGHWSVIGVSRPLPQIIEVNDVDLDPLRAHMVGVTLVEPASPYASAERAITYGMLVIALCLLTFLVLEHGMQLQLHPVQWLVNGLALVVFYLILLATSEHSGFHTAYGAASVVTVVLISAYTLIATRAWVAGASVFASLGLLYGAMYGMLRSEDHSLLMGTGLVVAALIGVMWVTRTLGHEGAAPPEAEPAT